MKGEERELVLARIGTAMADFCERWFPDAFVFALAAVLLVFGMGLAIGEAPSTLVEAFGEGFWVLVPFTMQMALIIIGGFVVASSRPCSRLIERIAAVPATPRGAVAWTAFFAMTSSLLSWGFSLIFTGLLVRAIVRRLEVDYRAIGGAAYLGLGAVWALGFSSSAALMQATRSAIPPDLLKITGVVPLSETIFLRQNVALATILIAVGVAIAWLSYPRHRPPRTFASIGVVYEPLVIERESPSTPADRIENTPILSVAVATIMVAFLVMRISERGLISTLDLNNFNLAFLAAGMLLHWRPRAFLKAVVRSVPAVAGVLIQFPFYAGVFGLISMTSIQETLAEIFVAVTNPHTFNPIVAIYSMILDLFIPSGGGKWVVEAPYVMAAAREWSQHLGWTIQTYNAAEGLANLMNPFWMLPLMGILNVRARDLAGYSILQLLCQLPLVLLLCWLFNYTLPYVPPILP
ncbi:MAG TPA: TIGR00366 family protein [Thermoanaerobaculia bacterium]|nr:TIGR00366 family protein [Thermoanaerobaculia bacterium]